MFIVFHATQPARFELDQWRLEGLKWLRRRRSRWCLVDSQVADGTAIASGDQIVSDNEIDAAV